MKRVFKALLPRPVLDAYRQARQALEARRNAGRTAEQVFTDIYAHNRWGGRPGEFFSGLGSSDAAVVGPYVAAVSAFLRAFPGGRPRVVDVGCGDFSVGRQFLDLCSEYVAVDVVPALIAHLRATVRDPRVRFECLDVAAADLPPGDVCFVRQVLQHLSNAQIAAILPKLGRYPTVFVTEHYPTPDRRPTPNLDMVHGADIRLYRNSGVYLDAPPFSVPAARLELVAEIPVAGPPELPPGVIRTFKLTN